MLASSQHSALLTSRFDDALIYASQLHAAQRRKSSGCPFLAHLLGVCSLVLEDGGDEDQAIAALLHDAVEDQGGEETAIEIERRFGLRVADLVWDCTEIPSPLPMPWRERKEAFIASLDRASGEALRIIAADKLYNARAVLQGYRENGEDLWHVFSGRREGTLWYYRKVADTLARLAEPGYLVDELERVVIQIEQCAAAAVQTA